ncbi:LysE family transporter [Rhizobium sp. Root1220]|uniref:LysE family transporter n=1 Tax=Rhizobium sp. Root1220 TaxID=1736432 RepID=UPI0006F8D185|nr:LysE family transporter [Rhizobium sp. Root1220]KQV78724.1 lysine transporter LysE [Rhizobium sp. Root1220]
MFLLSVATIWAVAAITPGPNFFIVVRTALQGSGGASVAVIGGVVLGTLCWGVAGWLGISALFAAAPFAYLFLKIAGGAYLLWLGAKLLWRTYGNAGGTENDVPQLAITPRQAFWSGLATNLANPKSAVFVASIFAATLPAEHSWLQGASAVATMVLVSSLWYTFVLAFLRNPAVAQAYTRGRKVVDVAAGAIFVGFGFKLLTSVR